MKQNNDKVATEVESDRQTGQSELQWEHEVQPIPAIMGELVDTFPTSAAGTFRSDDICVKEEKTSHANPLSLISLSHLTDEVKSC